MSKSMPDVEVEVTRYKAPSAQQAMASTREWYGDDFCVPYIYEIENEV